MKVSMVTISGQIIGITGLEEIFQEVRSGGIGNADELKGLILNKVREMNYIPSSAEPAYREELYEEYLVFTGELAERKRTGSALEIRLYGSSCYNCEKLDSMVKEILSRAGIAADYLHVTDMREIARAGIIATPAITVAGTMILHGQVPEEKRLEEILFRAMEKAKEGK